MGFANHEVKIGGQFTNEYGIIFEFSRNVAEHGWDDKFSSDEENAMARKCNAVIYVHDPMRLNKISTRLALIKKTVCYFITDDENGNLVFEKMKYRSGSYHEWNHSCKGVE